VRYQRLHPLGVRRDGVRVHDWDHDACVRRLRCIPTVPSDYPADSRPDANGFIYGRNEVGADAPLGVTSAYRKDQEEVVRPEPRAPQPLDVARAVSSATLSLGA